MYLGIFTVCFLKFAFELLVSIDDVKEDKNRVKMNIGSSPFLLK